MSSFRNPSTSLSTVWRSVRSRARASSTPSKFVTAKGRAKPFSSLLPTARGIPTNVPWRQLTAEQRRLILDGDAENDYEGVKGFFNWLERKKYKLHVRVFLSRFRGYATCPECGGTRLRAEARAVRVAGKPITEVSKLTVKEARAFFSTLQLSEGHMSIADRILEEIRTRLQFLDEVGL